MSDSLTVLADFEGDDGEDPDQDRIRAWATEHGGLPEESAYPFAVWLDQAWNDYDDSSGTQTRESVLEGALEFWTGRS